MEICGKQIIGSSILAEGSEAFRAVNPATGSEIEPVFTKVTEAEIDKAMVAADHAFEEYRLSTGEQRATFLEAIAEGILALGDDLIERGVAETGLPAARLTGERGRTVNQLRLFASVAREGSWVDARIDTAIPDRQPLPKPDLRRMLIPMGPVVVFGASNFPLAFSVAGGDTASALAAGCPVVAKAHAAHPGVSELVARAVQQAAAETKMPEGVFSLLQGRGHEIGQSLAKHPMTKAIGFTGSLTGGRALFDTASAREVPIPVYAEMGSINPVFVLPDTVHENSDAIAKGLAQSVTMGSGQFCTNPGLVVGLKHASFSQLIEQTAEAFRQAAPGTMLYRGLCDAYRSGTERLEQSDGVTIAGRTSKEADPSKTEAAPTVFRTDAKTFLANRRLSEEVFGPATLFVEASTPEDLEQIARRLEGQLTATVHATETDFKQYTNLISILRDKAGRLLFNGFPTGVEVCPSMNHGGPYPATTDVQSTSVGTAAILRFARPICYQDCPVEILPAELDDRNSQNIWRTLDGEWTKNTL